MQYLLTEEEYGEKYKSKNKEIEALKADLEKANKIINKFRKPFRASISTGANRSMDPLNIQKEVYTVTYLDKDLDIGSKAFFRKIANKIRM